MQRFEINELAKEESWRLFRIIGEFVEGFDSLPAIEPAVTVFGSSRAGRDSSEYKMARQIGRMLAERGYGIITGGGPGVMEAANRGAAEVGGRTAGLHIELPNQEGPNSYASLVLSFRYFFVRKVMLVKYASAFVLLPGGYGTLDEFTETIMLIQTGKVRPFPVVLVGSRFWKGMIEWLRREVLRPGYIDEADLNIFRVVDRAEEAVGHIVDLVPVPPRPSA